MSIHRAAASKTGAWGGGGGGRVGVAGAVDRGDQLAQGGRHAVLDLEHGRHRARLDPALQQRPGEDRPGDLDDGAELRWIPGEDQALDVRHRDPYGRLDRLGGLVHDGGARSRQLACDARERAEGRRDHVGPIEDVRPRLRPQRAALVAQPPRGGGAPSARQVAVEGGEGGAEDRCGDPGFEVAVRDGIAHPARGAEAHDPQALAGGGPGEVIDGRVAVGERPRPLAARDQRGEDLAEEHRLAGARGAPDQREVRAREGAVGGAPLRSVEARDVGLPRRDLPRPRRPDRPRERARVGLSVSQRAIVALQRGGIVPPVDPRGGALGGRAAAIEAEIGRSLPHVLSDAAQAQAAGLEPDRIAGRDALVQRDPRARGDGGDQARAGADDRGDRQRRPGVARRDLLVEGQRVEARVRCLLGLPLRPERAA